LDGRPYQQRISAFAAKKKQKSLDCKSPSPYLCNPLRKKGNSSSKGDPSSVITTLFLSHLSENKLKINKEKFGGFKKPLTFATRFEKSESSSKGFLQNNSQQNKFSQSVIQ